MKTNLVAALALAAAGVVCSAAAKADGFFLDGRVGRSDFENGKDTSYGISGGYRWGMFGLEGGYTDLGRSDPGYVGGISGLHQGIDLSGWTAGVNGHFELSPAWYLKARAGLFHWQADMNFAASPDAEFSDTDWYAGVGVGYKVSERVGIGLNYDHFRAEKQRLDFNADTISVNTEIRF